MLSIDGFEQFFSSLNGGHQPFSWQLDLFEYVIKHGEWPELIAAPTGSGKSSVVDIHVYLCALNAVGVIGRVPRRIHTVVNRRGLVDNQYQRAVKIQEILDRQHDDQTLIGEVSRALRSLHVGSDLSSSLAVALLRGGLSSRDLPINDPSACAVIASTPDMWGSRALFHGYGSTKLARPRETALMTMDSVVVVDESHLNRQLLATARRIRELQELGSNPGVPLLQVVETTATPHDGLNRSLTITVDPSGLQAARDQELSKRVHSAKSLRLLPIEKWTGKPAAPNLVASAFGEVTRLVEQNQRTGTIGCIVNHVDSAVKISQKLRQSKLRVALLVGRMRPADLDDLQQRFPRLLTPQGEDEIDVVVATQTLEVGVDVDFRSLVTELAPGSAIAQRAGRVNRRGLYDDSEVVVLVPESVDSLPQKSEPYSQVDLRNSLEWLHDLSQGGSINPAALNHNPSPSPTPLRSLFQRLELRDVELLSQTNSQIACEPELELWLRDSLEEEVSRGGIIVRDGLPAMDASALELLKAIPPREEEVFPASIAILRDLQTNLVVGERRRISLENSNPEIRRRLFVSRHGEISQVDETFTINPGDILIVDRGLPFTTENVASLKPEDASAPQAIELLHVREYVNCETTPIKVKELMIEAVELSPEELTQRWYEAFPSDENASVEASALLYEGPRSYEEQVSWIVVRMPAEQAMDPKVIQEWAPETPALLDDHQAAVAERAETLADCLGITSSLRKSIHTASLHHDDGKSDHRFQRMLGNLKVEKGLPLLAKSEHRSNQQRIQALAQSGLPLHWRHEQYSAVLLEEKRRAGIADADDLAVYLVGVSHGYGRMTFPLAGDQLVDDSVVAREFFNEGEWESLVTRVGRALGPYTVAFAEFVERAADAQISKEGR